MKACQTKDHLKHFKLNVLTVGFHHACEACNAVQADIDTRRRKVAVGNAAPILDTHIPSTPLLSISENSTWVPEGFSPNPMAIPRTPMAFGIPRTPNNLFCMPPPPSLPLADAPKQGPVMRIPLTPTDVKQSYAISSSPYCSTSEYRAVQCLRDSSCVCVRLSK